MQSADMMKQNQIQKQNKIITLLRKVSLRIRLTAAFLLLSILPLLMVTAISLNIYSSSIRKKLTQASLQSIQLSYNSTNAIMNTYNESLNGFSIDDEVQNFLKSSGNVNIETAHAKLIRSLTKRGIFNLVSTRTVDESIITMDGEKVIYLHGSVLLDQKQTAEMICYADESSPYNCLYCFTSLNGDKLIAMTRKIFDKNLSNTPIGYISVYFSATEFSKESLQTAYLGENTNFLLVNTNGIILASQNQSLIGNTMERFKDAPGNRKQNLVHETASGTLVSNFNKRYNIYTVADIPSSLINSEIIRVRGIVISLTVLILVVALILVLIICRTVTIPVSNITNIYHTEGNTLPTGRVLDQSPDELGYLARTIDTLADQNSRMIEQLKESNEKKRKLELEMLRYQINPHFLFNTLNTFKWIATLNDIPVLSEGIGSLSSMLQNTLIDCEEFIPLNKEIRLLKDYCNIQNLRYVECFETTFEIPEECNQIQIPRYILQPLVENSIVHGFQEAESLIHITITSQLSGGELEIQVSDDGIGFDIDKIMDLETGSYMGIGLSNVDSRLQLYYGSEHRLIIHSTPGKGTQCTIHIPI